MTAAQFRRLALSLPETAEGAHMAHPDFRVGGKIFATLGYPKSGFGAVMLSPQDQDFFIQAQGDAFVPAPGAWGAQGSTIVTLQVAKQGLVRAALRAAWEYRQRPKARKATRAPAKRRAIRKSR